MEKSVQEFQKNVLQLGLDIIREQFESIDERIKPSEKRKKKWSVVKSDPNSPARPVSVGLSRLF